MPAIRKGLRGLKGHYGCVRKFSDVDYTEVLNRIAVPALVIHRDDDQIVPIAAAGLKSSKILPNATLKIYEGAPHGLTMPEKFNADLLAFIKG